MKSCLTCPLLPKQTDDHNKDLVPGKKLYVVVLQDVILYISYPSCQAHSPIFSKAKEARLVAAKAAAESA